MSSSLPPDPVELEQTIRAKIRDILESVPDIGKVWMRERFVSHDESDVNISTVPDPVVPSLARTRILQIGIPTVAESPYTGDECTQLEFTYPITFDMEVVDQWISNGAYPFTNSQDLCIALYMKARYEFKKNRTLGFNNCEHQYLQQISAVTAEPQEETMGQLHAADWSLTVKVTGVLV